MAHAAPSSSAYKSSKSRRPSLAVSAATTTDAEMIPASAELPAEHHAEVAKAAREEGRTFAGQLRFIVRAWVSAQSAGK